MDSDIHAPGTKRRRATLTKNPPPSAYPSASSSAYTSNSALRKPQSQAALHRAPSAPSPYLRTVTASQSSHFHQRTQSTGFDSSTSSLERISGAPSPIISSTDYFPPNSNSHRGPQTLPPTQPSDERHKDLIGAPFDASGLLLSFQTTGKTRAQNEQQQYSSPVNYTSPDLRHHPLRNSQTINPGGIAMMEITPPKSENGIMSPKRFSSDGSNTKPPGPLRKKSGFSSFVNNMLGSPRTIKISAPQDPMHMIHVGYDNQTGQFTVCQILSMSDSLFLHSFSKLYQGFELTATYRDSPLTGRESSRTVAFPKTNKIKILR